MTQAILHQVFAGLATGGIYASLALALVMIYQATHLVNFAQGEMAMFCTYIAWSLLNAGLPYWGAFVATIIIAFKFRITLSVRQSFANSTAARRKLLGNCSSFDSNRSCNACASATLPANPAITFSFASRLTFRAVCFMIVPCSPMVTWPSAATATFPSRNTAITVVDRIMPGFYATIVPCRMVFRSRELCLPVLRSS